MAKKDLKLHLETEVSLSLIHISTSPAFQAFRMLNTIHKRIRHIPKPMATINTEMCIRDSYIGDGKIIHASNAATGIKISDYDYEQPAAIGTFME